jgi:hypothetical protein
MRSLVFAAALLAAAGASARTLQAQSAAYPDHLRDRWQLSVAGSGFRAATTMRIDASDGSAGTEVSTDDLGLAETGFQPRFAARWRPGRRHEVEAVYQLVRRSGERVLADTLVFRDTSYAAGLRVQSHVKSDVASLTYRFAFRMRERNQIGLAVGLGALNFATTIDAVAGATTGGPDTSIVEYSRSGSTLAPTFAAGLYGRWRTGDRWYIEADARALYVPVDRITVAVVEGGGVVRYFVSPKFGLEFGYALNAVGLRLDPKSDGSGLAGKIRLGIQTIRLGVVAAL